MSDAFDVIIGVSVGLLMLFTLLCGCAVCNDPTPSTENSRIPTRNNTLSSNNRVQNEEDSNTPSSHLEGSFQRIERTEDL